MREKNILLTGKPGVGKTTLVKKFIERLNPEDMGGFYTEEIRKGGQREGFLIRTLKGKEGTLASVNIDSRFKVGRYKVNIHDLENIGVAALEQAIGNAGIIIIDEIGKMELFSRKFRDTVMRALDSKKRVLATIKESGDEFINAIKRHKDTIVLTITRENRKSVLLDLTYKWFGISDEV
jgi:nucleoside-triphosphatase